MSISQIKFRILSFCFFDDFIVIYPLYAVMFADYGLSVLQISLLLFAWSFTSFVLEVPCGVMADKYSRKHILILGQIIRAIGYSLWLIFPNFWGFLIGFILWGVKGALTSGTFEALVYDELRRLNSDQSYAKMKGQAEACGLAAVVMAGLGASLLSRYGYSMILVASISSVLLAALSISLLPSAKHIRLTTDLTFWQHTRQGLHQIQQNRYVLQIVLFTSFGLGIAAVDEFFSLFYKNLGLNNAQIGLWSAIISLAGIVGSLIAYKISHLSDIKLITLMFMWGGILAIASLTKAPLALLMVGVFVLLFQTIKVILDAKLQHAIEDKTRATVTSFQGLLSEGAALTTFVLFGTLTQLTSIAIALTMFSLIILVFSVAAFSMFMFADSKTQSI